MFKNILVVVLFFVLFVFGFSQRVTQAQVRSDLPKVTGTQSTNTKQTAKKSTTRRTTTNASQNVIPEENVTNEEVQSYTPSYETKGRDYELMKKYNRLTQLFTELKRQIDTAVATASYYQAQTQNCDTYQREAAFYKTKADALTVQFVKPTDNAMKIKLVDSKIDFKVVDAVGNKEEQTVTINFVITNNKPHQIVRLNNPYDGKVRSVAYDDYGTTFYPKSVQIGDKRDAEFLQDLLLTNVPRKGSIVLRNVLSSVQKFKYVLINWRNYNYDGGENEKKGQIEIKNLKIDWKK